MINIKGSNGMKKSIYRLKDYIESHKCNIYLIANDDLVGDIYRGYVEDELKTDNYIAVIRETNMYSAMNDITNKDKECIILLCGNWYKNPLVRKHNLLDIFSNNKCYTIPIDEIEKSPVECIINTNTFQYEVWTRDKYISYLCCNGSDLNNSIEIWNEVSKGYNFVIAIKSNDESIGYMIYSVGYFNDYIVGNKTKDDINKCIKDGSI